MPTHSGLTGAELHESKGAAAASKGDVAVANGAGAAVYQALLTKVVHVNALADLPTAAGGKITLAANTSYQIGDNINIGTDFLLFSNGTHMRGSSAFVNTITYTGTSPMIKGVDADMSISNISLSCVNSDVYDVSETTGDTKIFVATDVRYIVCKKLGTFDKMRTVGLRFSTVVDCTGGLIFTGAATTSVRLSSMALLSTSTSFIGIDFTGSTMKTVDIDALTFTGGAGSIGIKGDAASANITTGFLANVTNCQFKGVTTPLSGITVDDIRYSFVGNGEVRDSQADAMVALTGNATVTVLTVGVPALVLGTWSLERASQFTTTTAGRATLSSERDVLTPIDISVVVNPASGTNKTIRAYVALNGTEIASSGISINVDAGDPRQISIPWQLNLSTGDFVEVFIENVTDSVNVTVTDATLRLR